MHRVDEDDALELGFEVGLVSSFSTTRQLQRCVIAQILAGGERVEMHS